MVPISRSMKACERGAEGMDLISSTSRIRRFAPPVKTKQRIVIRGKIWHRVPTVVIEIVLGIVARPHVLRWIDRIDPTSPIGLLAQVGSDSCSLLYAWRSKLRASRTRVVVGRHLMVYATLDWLSPVPDLLLPPAGLDRDRVYHDLDWHACAYFPRRR